LRLHRKGEKSGSAPLSWVEVAIETPATTDAFLDDFKASLATWRKVPLLPIVTAVVALVSAVTVPSNGSFPIFVVGLLIGFFSIGWLGTQFIWYRRAFDGQSIHSGELIPLTWSFIARYFWLYFLALIPLFVLVAVAIRWRRWEATSPGWRIGVLAYVLVLSIVLTFINPTLAFTTRRVTKAIPSGLRMLVQNWPRNWMYVVVPGVVAAALGGVYWLVPSPGRPVLEIFTFLIYLVFAGAIARYYLRTPLAPSERGN
jgi:hypothetical protein